MGYCFILINTLAMSFFVKPYRRPAIILTTIILAIGIFAQHEEKTLTPSSNWVALNTNSHFIKYDSYLTTLVHEQIEAGKKVIILPENGVNLGSYQKNALWKNLLQELKQNQATLVTGAQGGAGNDKAHQEGVLIISPNQTEFDPTRQPLPIVSWNPLTNRIPAHWFENGVYSLQNQQMGLFVCFENFLPWMMIMTTQRHPVF